MYYNQCYIAKTPSNLGQPARIISWILYVRTSLSLYNGNFDILTFLFVGPLQIT